jgi:hypothetical protein
MQATSTPADGQAAHEANGQQAFAELLAALSADAAGPWLLSKEALQRMQDHADLSGDNWAPYKAVLRWATLGLTPSLQVLPQAAIVQCILQCIGIVTVTLGNSEFLMQAPML